MLNLRSVSSFQWHRNEGLHQIFLTLQMTVLTLKLDSRSPTELAYVEQNWVCFLDCNHFALKTIWVDGAELLVKCTLCQTAQVVLLFCLSVYRMLLEETSTQLQFSSFCKAMAPFSELVGTSHVSSQGFTVLRRI